MPADFHYRREIQAQTSEGASLATHFSARNITYQEQKSIQTKIAVKKNRLKLHLIIPSHTDI
jgi:hypothetical protein